MDNNTLVDLDQETIDSAAVLFARMQATLQSALPEDTRSMVSNYDDALFHASIDACYDIILAIAKERRDLENNPVQPDLITLMATMGCIGEMYVETMFGEASAAAFREAYQETRSLDGAARAASVAPKRENFN